MAMAGFNTDILSDETFDFLCTVCKNKGKNTEAAKYCTDCGDYYCSTCVKVHEDVPSLKGHKILDQGKTKSGRRKQLPAVQTERCDRHGHKHVDMYCQNHDNVGCAACMAVEHRSCQDIFYMPEFIQNNASTSSTPNIRKKLESTEKTLQLSLTTFEQEKQNVLKRKAESIENIRKLRRDINKRLDEMERKSVAEIEDKYKAVIQEIEDDIRVLQENKAYVTSARDTLASAGNNVSQEFVGTKKGHAAASKAEKAIDETKAGNHKETRAPPTDAGRSTFFPFDTDPRLANMLEELHFLGQITLKYNRKAKQLRPAEEVKQKDSLLQTKGMKRYSVKLPSDTGDCNIFSSCFLEDGTVVLADRGNNKLKLLDKDTSSVRDRYDLPWTPWQVCSINKEKVAVSSCSQSEILFVTIRHKMTKQSSIKVEFNCYGLACAGGNLYISDGKTTVYMYTLSGHKIKQFSFVQSTIYNISSLAVSKDSSKIYAAIPVHGLIVLNNTGKVVKKFNDSMLEYAYDCYVTDRGSVLVCGYVSNNVLQFTPDGELMGEVVTSDRCQTACCNWQMSKMIVGKAENEIEVYDLV